MYDYLISLRLSKFDQCKSVIIKMQDTKNIARFQPERLTKMAEIVVPIYKAHDHCLSII